MFSINSEPRESESFKYEDKFEDKISTYSKYYDSRSKTGKK